MHRNKKLYNLLVSLLIGITACTNTTVEPNSRRLGFQFFPIQIKQPSTYSVEEINYLNDGTIDTLRYELVDVLTDSTVTSQGTRFTGFRYRKENNDSVVTSTLTLEKTQSYISQRLGNGTEVKLSFPVMEGLEWNGTPQAMEADSFAMEQLYQLYDFQDSTFSSLTVVQENNEDSIILLDRRIEVYAEGVGLLYKEFSQLDFCNETECLGLQQIDFGKTIRMSRVIE